MSAWKACDIRGRWPGEVSAGLLRETANRVTALLRPTPRVLIAGDFRASTPELKSAVAEGLLRAGARVLDAGQVPTPVAYFAHGRERTDAVLIVTASHNPPDHNGLKLMLGQLPPEEAGLEDLHRRLDEPPIERVGGTLERIDPWPGYLAWVRDRWRGSGARIHVVLDAGNGAWSEAAPALFEELGMRVHRLYCEIDGRFPNRPPDSARPANLSALRETVRREHADLGIAWDGDGDRVAFVDGAGEVASADEVSILLIRYLLKGRHGGRVVYDIKLSDAVRRAVVECGGVPQMERSGHAFLKRSMIREHCVFGCEVSGHYFYDELGGGDDGLFTALTMADLVSREGPLACLRTTLPAMFVTPDLRLRGAAIDFGDIAGRLREALHLRAESTLDGVRFETDDGFVLARPSVTESAVTLRMEGRDAASLARLRDRVTAALPEFATVVAGRF